MSRAVADEAGLVQLGLHPRPRLGLAPTAASIATSPAGVPASTTTTTPTSHIEFVYSADGRPIKRPGVFGGNGVGARAPTTAAMTTALLQQQHQAAVWQQLLLGLKQLEVTVARAQGARERGHEWLSGMMIDGAKHMGRRLLSSANEEGEVLRDEFTIHLPQRSCVTGLFLLVQWPDVNNSQVVPRGRFRVEVDEAQAWRLAASVEPTEYGVRINAEGAPWHTTRIRVRFERGHNVGVAALDNYKLKATHLSVHSYPAPHDT